MLFKPHAVFLHSVDKVYFYTNPTMSKTVDSPTQLFFLFCVHHPNYNYLNPLLITVLTHQSNYKNPNICTIPTIKTHQSNYFLYLSCTNPTIKSHQPNYLSAPNQLSPILYVFVFIEVYLFTKSANSK